MVSILVLLDDAYRLIEGYAAVFNTWIQSLFFWMMPTGIKGLLFLLFNPMDSILVLLDDAYRQQPSLNLLIR